MGGEIDRLIQTADRLGDYLVGLSKSDDRIRDDEQLHALVEDLYAAVVDAKEARYP